MGIRGGRAERENVETVRRLYEAIDDDGLKALADVAHPGIEVFPPLGRPDGVVLRGPEQVRRFARLWSEMFEVRVEPQRFVDEGDRVLVLVHDRGRVKESGDRIDSWWIHLWTLSGGRIVQWEVFPYDEVLSLEAAGLRE